MVIAIWIGGIFGMAALGWHARRLSPCWMMGLAYGIGVAIGIIVHMTFLELFR